MSEGGEEVELGEKRACFFDNREICRYKGSGKDGKEQRERERGRGRVCV